MPNPAQGVEAAKALLQLGSALKGRLNPRLVQAIEQIVQRQLPDLAQQEGLVEKLASITRGVTKDYERTLPARGALQPGDITQEALAELTRIAPGLPAAQAASGKSLGAILNHPLRDALDAQSRSVGKTLAQTQNADEVTRALIRLESEYAAKGQSLPGVEDVAKLLEAKGYKRITPDAVRDAQMSVRPALSTSHPKAQMALAEDTGLSDDVIKMLYERVYPAAEQLPLKKQQALDLRLGLTGEPSTLEGTAKALGMKHASGAQQAYDSAIKTLQNQLGVIPGKPGPGAAEQALTGLAAERDELRAALARLTELRHARGGPAVSPKDELESQIRLMKLDKLLEAAGQKPVAGTRTTRGDSPRGAGFREVTEVQRPSLGLTIKTVPRPFKRERTGSAKDFQSGEVRRLDPKKYQEQQIRSRAILDRSLFDLVE